jgi:hypothetical protein
MTGRLDGQLSDSLQRVHGTSDGRLRKPSQPEDKNRDQNNSKAIPHCSEEFSESPAPRSDRRYISSCGAPVNLEDGSAAVSRDRAQFIQGAATHEGSHLRI